MSSSLRWLTPIAAALVTVGCWLVPIASPSQAPNSTPSQAPTPTRSEAPTPTRSEAPTSTPTAFPTPTSTPTTVPPPAQSPPPASQADILGAVGVWIVEMDLVSDFAYIDEALVDSFAGIEGRYGFDPEEEPELYDLGTVGEPVFGPRLTKASRAALRVAFDGVELQFIADWRSFEENRPVCDLFTNGRRAVRLSAPMPHQVEGSPNLVAVNIDAGTCEGLTYVLEVGWKDSAFEVWRIVREGDWIAN